MTRIFWRLPTDMERLLHIDGDEFHYLTRVKRHKATDRVIVVDPTGRAVSAEITQIDKRQAILRLDPSVEVPTPKPVLDIHIMMALPKGNLMDDTIRKTNEIGAMRIVPFLASRTSHTIASTKEKRWQKIAVESTRQCGRELPMQVDPICKFDRLFDTLPQNHTKLMLHPTAEIPLPRLIPKTGPVTLLIGPEGGFTDSEINIATSAGFVSAVLPMPILRIETAAIAATVLAVALQEWPHNRDAHLETNMN